MHYLPPPGNTGWSTRCLRPRAGFSLIELMLATAILCVILVLVFGVIQQISSAWKSSSSKIEAFQASRAAFDTMSRQLSQATLNTYYDYFDVSGGRRTKANAATFVPHHYGRYSDLHYISGGWSAKSSELVPSQITHAMFFQAPMGFATGKYATMETLLDACGYFIAYGEDPARPAFLELLPNKPPTRRRFRLMQFSQPSEQFAVYDDLVNPKKWFTAPLGNGADPLTVKTAPLPPIRQLAENVIALVVLPRQAKADAGTLTTDYEYDSRRTSGTTVQLPSENQLPPVIEVVMVAIDEASALRMGNTTAAPIADLGLDKLFKVPGQLETDLQTLASTLIAKKYTYRVFRTAISVKGSKWSGT